MRPKLSNKKASVVSSFLNRAHFRMTAVRRSFLSPLVQANLQRLYEQTPDLILGALGNSREHLEGIPSIGDEGSIPNAC
jgi:hypothetical protein